MKKILFLMTLILMTLQSCENSLKEEVFGESIYNYDDFQYILFHKTSDCEYIKNGIYPVDTTRLWWRTNSHEGVVSVRFCSKCLNDEEIRILREHREHCAHKIQQAEAEADAQRISPMPASPTQ